MSCGKFVFPSHPSHYLPLPILDVLILALASESQALLDFSPLPSSILISLHLHSVSFFSALLSLNSSVLSSFLSKNCFNTGYWCQNQKKHDLETRCKGKPSAPKTRKITSNSSSQFLAQPPQMRFASNALQRTVELDAQQLCRATLMESFQCDLQATNCKRQ